MRLNLTMIFLLLFTWCFNAPAQNIENNLKAQLDSLASTVPALNERLNLSVSELPLNEFIRAVAHESGLNVNIASSLNESISNNFSNVVVKDILVFLNRSYNVNVSIIGGIIDFSRSETSSTDFTPTIKIDYHSEKNLVSFEINDAPVHQVAKEITIQTGQNIVVMPGLSGSIVQSYVKNMPVSSAIDKLGVGNGFQVKKSNDGFYIFEPQDQPIEQDQQWGTQRQRSTSSSAGSSEKGLLTINAWSLDSIDIKAANADLKEVVSEVFEKLELPSYTIGELTGSVNVDLKGVTIEKFLEHIFNGTQYVSKLKDNIYWFGARDVIEMLDFKLYQMRYRSVDSVVHIMPESIKKGLEIKEYKNLNSLILAGPRDRIKEITEFLTIIDRVVPVILIEVLIIDNKDSRALSTGIAAGLSDKAPVSSQTVLPALDVTLGSETVNRLIDGFNDFGWVNLGKVTPKFYLTLQALEENGSIEMRSTPQLSTLNGHKATMSIGKTEYYKEELNIMYGSVTASSQTTTTYKPVEAEFKLEIRPLVAGNREVTLEILVEQSDFTERIEKNAPPGKVTRKFESLIRVKDMEMILLGGLEEANLKDVRTGLPLISRIPILNWFTSSRSKSKSKSKLNIFIKPTIIY